MKKFIFIMPLMAVSLLASCGGSKPSVIYHTITFHSNEGSEVPALIVEDGKLAVEPKDPLKDGFCFMGWYTTETLEKETLFTFETKITQDYDLYADWMEEGKIYNVTLESDNILDLEKEVCVLDHEDYVSKITLKSQFKEKYDLPYSKPYYQVEVDGNQIDNFYIDKIGDNIDYCVNITIPKEFLGNEIVIKTKPYCHYLTFTGVDDNAIIYYLSPYYFAPDEIEIMYCYSLDNPHWEKWEFGDENAVHLAKKQTIYVKNTKNSLSTYNDHFISFGTGIEGSPGVSAGGNIMSLINFSDLSEYCFYLLFGLNSCKSLISAPVLPATTLKKLCYSGMFSDCTSLVSAPELPATTLANGCYSGMFWGCSALLTAPNLPAEKLMESCYETMFNGCSSLKINNEGNGTKFLSCPLDTTPLYCVQNMFSGTGGDYTADPVAGESYYYTID